MMVKNTGIFSNSRSRLSAVHYERHLMSWLRIKFWDIGDINDYALVPARSSLACNSVAV